MGEAGLARTVGGRGRNAQVRKCESCGNAPQVFIIMPSFSFELGVPKQKGNACMQDLEGERPRSHKRK